jgi:DNA-binding NtrC family response regulator
MSFPLLSNPMPLDAKAFHYRGAAAGSPVMRRIFSMLERIERTRESVLLGGERGVGKTRIARALHEGASADAPFVVVDGTSAVNAAGEAEAITALGEAFARATGGTLVLRDVDELPATAQDALLQLLPVYVGCLRVIATSTKSLEDEVQHKRFKEELYDKLAAIRIYIPPLRHRAEDIPVLARAFAAELGARPLAPAVMADLASRGWTGNVEELKRTVSTLVSERAARESGIVPSGDGTDGTGPLEGALGLDQELEAMIDISIPYADLKEQLCARFARVYLTVLIAHTRGNRTEAARIAGLDRTYLGRMLVKLGVPVPR